MKEFFPTSTPIKASEDPYTFNKIDNFIMPDTYEFEGEEKQIEEEDKIGEEQCKKIEMENKTGQFFSQGIYLSMRRLCNLQSRT